MITELLLFLGGAALGTALTWGTMRKPRPRVIQPPSETENEPVTPEDRRGWTERVARILAENVALRRRLHSYVREEEKNPIFDGKDFRPRGTTGPDSPRVEVRSNRVPTIDDIIDKMSKTGYGSLSEEEREILRRHRA